MVKENDDIIVFRQFDTAIEANIAKTKLDAYGIPCFLTEENMSNLYPGQRFLAFRVRLHLFAKDEAQASSILQDVNLTSDADSTIRCPQCNSSRVARDFPKQARESLMFIFFGILFPHKKVSHCLDCDNEF